MKNKNPQEENCIGIVDRKMYQVQCFQGIKPVSCKLIFSFFMIIWKMYLSMDIVYNPPPTAMMEWSHDIGLVQELIFDQVRLSF